MPSVLASVRPAFRAIATTCVPEAAGLSDADWVAFEDIVEHALAQRPAKVRRQLGLLIRIIDVLPVFTAGRRFRGLSPDHRLRLLSRLEHAPLLLVRRGVWGLRTLAFMGFYARPAAGAAIGYRAHRLGWEARA